MPLDATVGGSASNSYVTEAEADLYFENRLYSDNWNTFADTENALILATSMIDWYITWIGHKTSIDQALGWPRTGAILPSGDEIDDDVIPNPVKVAVYELALAMTEEDVTLDNELKGFKKIKADTLEMELDGSSRNPLPNAMPDRIYKILSDLISSGNTAGSVKVIRLGRA